MSLKALGLHFSHFIQLVFVLSEQYTNSNSEQNLENLMQNLLKCNIKDIKTTPRTFLWYLFIYHEQVEQNVVSPLSPTLLV